MRSKLQNYRVIQNRISKKLNYDKLPNHADILLFGPAGSGKSSLIRTFYRSLYEVKQLPEDISNQLVIKQKTQNEGTTEFTGVKIKDAKKEEQKDEKSNEKQSSIIVHDTRG